MEIDVDVLGVLYKGFLEEERKNANIFTNSCKFEKNFLTTLNAKQKQDYQNLKLLFKSDNSSEIKNAIKYTLKFISNINTFEKDKTKLRFD